MSMKPVTMMRMAVAATGATVQTVESGQAWHALVADDGGQGVFIFQLIDDVERILAIGGHQQAIAGTEQGRHHLTVGSFIIDDQNHWANIGACRVNSPGCRVASC